MPDSPQPTPTADCPDDDCRAPIGTRHGRECTVAICVTTGQQRLLHDDLPTDDAHTCGADVWTGSRHGAQEAAARGLFVRPATVADHPLTGWIPCRPGEPGAAPDLDRLVRSSIWSPTRQVFEPAQVQ